ncbi:MAG: hypothetical protein WAN43_18055 [Rhodomicrobium sp.]|jgi:hypothetical protein
MTGADALAVALAMLERPHSVRLAQHARLPAGVTLLLEIAAGEGQAISRATRLTGRSDGTLQKAAGFFIEQVLLQPGGDSYRVLGCNRGAAICELRRNMALIMRWLHPDVAANGSSDSRMSRSVFANRITQAWASIKTEERRSAYDAALAAKEREASRKAVPSKALRSDHKERRVHAGLKSSGRRLVIQRVQSEGFWSRLRQLLGGHR